MFCSRCGKTIPRDAAACPSCGLEVGESRFDGSPYTAAQAHIQPGQDAPIAYTQNYTRINYTGSPEIVDRGDVDSRTTYRPTYDGDSIPEEMRRDLRANPSAPEPEDEGGDNLEGLSGDAVNSLHAVNRELEKDEVDYSQFRARPIESAGQSGISSDVSEIMQDLEEESARRAGRRRKGGAVYGDYEEAFEGEDVPADGEVPREKQDDVFDDIGDEDFRDMREPSGLDAKKIIKIIIALIVVAALFVGGVMWVRYARNSSESTTFTDVREELYTEGLELIKTHASDEYKQVILDAYTEADSSLLTLSSELDESTAEVSALLPEDYTETEQLFIEALNQIQSNIVNCIITDAMALSDEQAASDSEESWEVVNNAISMLEQATSVTDLNSIINGEIVEAVDLNATPSPTPAPNYNTLSKGDKSDEVLAMQERLAELGYLDGDLDGNFGTQTQTAVKMFQQVAGLSITGIADSETLAALYADDAPMPDLAPTATATAAATEAAETAEPTAEPTEAAE